MNDIWTNAKLFGGDTFFSGVITFFGSLLGVSDAAAVLLFVSVLMVITNMRLGFVSKELAELKANNRISAPRE